MDAVTLAALEDFPRQLEAYYALVPVERKNWRPASWEGIPSEPFTPIEQICHVRDIEIDGYQARFARTLQESNPYLPNIDGEALASERRYASAEPGQVFTAFRQARSKTVELVAALTPEQLARAAEFEGRPVTLGSLVHYLCSHDQQHLAGIQWLLAQMRSPAHRLP